nr:adenine deaminase [Caldilineaceae bacterium]
MQLEALLAVARGEKPADLVLRNAHLVNVFSGKIEETDIAVFAGRVAGIGAGYTAAQSVDLRGAFVTPGLIDAHVHIESSLCVPAQFARGVLPHGVTTAVVDPHEIANVAGAPGIRFMAAASRRLPLDVVVMAPSCVPATHMETNGARLDAADLSELLADGTVYGLAEVMNFPGVIHGSREVLDKLVAFAGRRQDGHAPALAGKMLNAYVAAGIGSEHECTTVAEAAEKLARGLY